MQEQMVMMMMKVQRRREETGSEVPHGLPVSKRGALHSDP